MYFENKLNKVIGRSDASGAIGDRDLAEVVMVAKYLQDNKVEEFLSRRVFSMIFSNPKIFNMLDPLIKPETLDTISDKIRYDFLNHVLNTYKINEMKDQTVRLTLQDNEVDAFIAAVIGETKELHPELSRLKNEFAQARKKVADKYQI